MSKELIIQDALYYLIDSHMVEHKEDGTFIIDIGPMQLTKKITAKLKKMGAIV